MLHNEEGVWVDDEERIKDMLNAFYHNIFWNDDFVRISCGTDLSFPSISY